MNNLQLQITDNRLDCQVLAVSPSIGYSSWFVIGKGKFTSYHLYSTEYRWALYTIEEDYSEGTLTHGEYEYTIKGNFMAKTRKEKL